MGAVTTDLVIRSPATPEEAPEAPSQSTALVAVKEHIEFQIGSNRNGFIYKTSKFQTNGHPIYECRRGYDRPERGERIVRILWLHRLPNSHWVAVEADFDSGNPVQEGVPMFKTMDPDIGDITQPGTVVWQSWEPCTASWEGSMEFNTKRLVAATHESRAGPYSGNDV